MPKLLSVCIFHFRVYVHTLSSGFSPTKTLNCTLRRELVNTFRSSLYFWVGALHTMIHREDTLNTCRELGIYSGTKYNTTVQMIHCTAKTKRPAQRFDDSSLGLPILIWESSRSLKTVIRPIGSVDSGVLETGFIAVQSGFSMSEIRILWFIHNHEITRYPLLVKYPPLVRALRALRSHLHNHS